MYNVPEADIILFAKGLKGRIGPLARKVARERSKQLSAMGDIEGEQAWARVAEAIKRLDTRIQ